MSDFNARAELHRVEMTTARMGQPIPRSPRFIYSGTVVDCVSKVMGKRRAAGILRLIRTGLR